MYREQCGEYAYWCQGIKSVLVGTQCYSINACEWIFNTFFNPPDRERKKRSPSVALHFYEVVWEHWMHLSIFLRRQRIASVWWYKQFVWSSRLLKIHPWVVCTLQSNIPLISVLLDFFLNPLNLRSYYNFSPPAATHKLVEEFGVGSRLKTSTW